MNPSESKLRFGSREYFQANRGKLAFCIGGSGFALIFLLIQFGGSLSALLPSESRMETMRRELKKLEQEEAGLNIQNAAANALRANAKKKFDEAWQAGKLGDPEVELRSLIEKTARAQSLKLNNISTVRKTKFNSDLSTLEVDVSVATDLDSLVKFLVAVDALEPKLYWRRFDFRPDNFSAANGISFNGTLRCLGDERAGAEKSPSETGKNISSADKAHTGAAPEPGVPPLPPAPPDFDPAARPAEPNEVE